MFAIGSSHISSIKKRNLGRSIFLRVCMLLRNSTAMGRVDRGIPIVISVSFVLFFVSLDCVLIAFFPLFIVAYRVQRQSAASRFFFDKYTKQVVHLQSVILEVNRSLLLTGNS